MCAIYQWCFHSFVTKSKNCVVALSTRIREKSTRRKSRLHKTKFTRPHSLASLQSIFNSHNILSLVCCDYIFIPTLAGFSERVTRADSGRYTFLLHDVAIPGGSELISLVYRSLAPNLTVARSRETQGMVSKL